MGMRLKDESVQKDAKHWPFRVIDVNDGAAAVEVEYKGDAKQFSPEQISAMVSNSPVLLPEMVVRNLVDQFEGF